MPLSYDLRKQIVQCIGTCFFNKGNVESFFISCGIDRELASLHRGEPKFVWARNLLNDLNDEAGFKKSMSEGGVLTEYNTDAAGYHPDAYGRINRENTFIDDKEFSVIYDYDIAGRVTGITSPSERRQGYQYNSLGELVRVPGLIDADITYNDAGRHEAASLSNGVELRWRYDINGRLLKKDYLGIPGAAKSWSLAYDDNDNILGLNERVYQYDDVNQMVYEQREDTYSEQMPLELSSISNDLWYKDFIDSGDSVTFPLENDMIEFDYNAGSLKVDFSGVIDIDKVVLTPESPIHRVDRYSLKVLSSQDQYSYEENNDWHLIDNDGTLNIVFSEPLKARYLKIHCTFDERDYEYNPVGTAQFKNVANQIIKVYAGNLVVARDTMSYDGIGNRQMEYLNRESQEAAHYSEYYSRNRRLKSNGISGESGRYGFVYDTVGNLVEKGEVYSEPAADQILIDQNSGDYWAYQWDLLNRLSEVTHETTSVSYRYSARGLRVKKTSDDTTYFVYDQWGNVIYQESGAGYRDYVYAFGKHLARIDGTIDSGRHTEGPTCYFHSNHIGTVEGITDELGILVWEASYTAFGEILSVTESSVFNQEPIFGGKTYDSDVHLYYFNARWYDAAIGKFISEDPVRMV